MARPKTDTANVHLHVLGEERHFSFPVRVGPAKLADLIPTARALTTQITAVAIAHAEAEGRQVSCRAGCGACCRQLVPISVLEARALAGVVAALPPKRREAVRARFAAAVKRMEEVGLLDPNEPRGRTSLRSAAAPGRAAWDDVSRRYFEAQIPCPFLEDESCSVHPDRPMVCREYNVTTPPERCGRLDGGAETVPRPARMSEALADAVNALTGAAQPSIPLTLALEWAAAKGRLLDGERDGEAMFWALLEQLDLEGEARGDG